MNYNNPKVSIVITCYNREKYIAEAINSAVEQDYRNLEIIISDNKSTDSSLSIIEKYAYDRRVIINVNSENIGAIPNFRKCGLEIASGDLITFVSSDDYLCDERFISKAVKRFVDDDNVVIVKGKNILKLEARNKFSEDNTYYRWRKKYYRRHKVEGRQVFLDYPKCPSIGFGGAVYKRNQLVDLEFARNEKAYYQDAEITLKILLEGSAVFIEDKTYVVRMHGGNDTGVISLKRIIENCEYIESPYRYAKSKKDYFEEHEILSWRNEMYRQYFIGQMKSTYRNKAIFKSLVEWLEDNEPLVLSRITRSLNWNAFRLLTSNSYIRSIYPSLGLLKAKLTQFIN